MATSPVITIPAYPGVGPNHIVSEANGYRSREQIWFKQNAEGGFYPSGLVLKIDDAEPDTTKTWMKPFDGTGDAAGILYQSVDVSTADTAATAHVRDCEMQRANLKFAAGLTDPQKEQAYTSLAAAHVVMR